MYKTLYDIFHVVVFVLKWREIDETLFEIERGNFKNGSSVFKSHKAPCIIALITRHEIRVVRRIFNIINDDNCFNSTFKHSYHICPLTFSYTFSDPATGGTFAGGHNGHARLTSWTSLALKTTKTIIINKFFII